MRTVLLAAALLCVVCSTSANACGIMRPCYGDGRPLFGPSLAQGTVSSRYDVRHRTAHRTHRRVPEGLARVMAEGAGRVVGGRPAGCPRRYCGCGASIYLFGKIVPSLNLAANWLRFPRAAPAPGMVAARRGHVFVLVRHIQGPIWLAHDSNSGHHRTRVHPRSIVGFAIVDPRAGA